ncbi:MAG: glycosyltransferase [Oscillospiraceae bacterium]|jgi:glycosyltransferase involved in cell wall biosynthesis|nr:glycosyltransferase [Oscillospiraceae bacterium]
MTIVLTQAWNATATLQRTIDSVLAQENCDFEYHIIDSASTDKTWDMILENALKDKRIRPIRKRINKLSSFCDYIQSLLHDPELPDNTTLTIVDADDTLLPGALETLNKTLKDTGADMACGGVQWEKNGQMQYRYIMDYVFDKEAVARHFDLVNAHMEPTWGKLYTFWLLRKCDLTLNHKLRCSGDALMVIDIFSHCHKVAFTGKVVLNYYYAPGSITKRYDIQRFRAMEMVHEAFIRYLESIGPVSEKNMKILYKKYYSTLLILISQLPGAPISSAERLRVAELYMGKELTHEAAASGGVEEDTMLELQSYVEVLRIAAAPKGEGS